MTEPTEAAGLLAEVKAGDQQAATDLFQRFANRLVGLARSRLDLDLRRKVDPEDVVQSVFGSFFRRNGAGEIDVQSWESLWSLLAVITVHKCGHKIRYYRAGKRAAGQEQSAVRYTEDSSIHWEAVARDRRVSRTISLAAEPHSSRLHRGLGGGSLREGPSSPIGPVALCGAVQLPSLSESHRDRGRFGG